MNRDEVGVYVSGVWSVLFRCKDKDCLYIYVSIQAGLSELDAASVRKPAYVVDWATKEMGKWREEEGV